MRTRAFGFPSGLIPGSVLFVGAGGLISQDNDKFFWNDANDRLGFGTSSPSAVIHIVQPNNVNPFIVESESNTSPGNSFFHHFASSSSNLLGGNITFLRSNGTTAAPTAVGDGNSLGNIIARSYVDAAVTGRSAQLNFASDGGSSPGSSPGRVTILTTPPGSTTPLDRVRVTALGSVCLCMAGALPTTATDGFTYLPSCLGAPTGVPTAINGIPCVIDSVNEKLWARFASGWKSVTFA